MRQLVIVITLVVGLALAGCSTDAGSELDSWKDKASSALDDAKGSIDEASGTVNGLKSSLKSLDGPERKDVQKGVDAAATSIASATKALEDAKSATEKTRADAAKALAAADTQLAAAAKAIDNAAAKTVAPVQDALVSLGDQIEKIRDDVAQARVSTSG